MREEIERESDNCFALYIYILTISNKSSANKNPCVMVESDINGPLIEEHTIN